jgi:hypothetical protein
MSIKFTPKDRLRTTRITVYEKGKRPIKKVHWGFREDHTSRWRNYNWWTRILMWLESLL